VRTITRHVFCKRLTADAPTEAFKRRAVALIGKAYSSLPLAAAQPYVGLPAEQTVAREWDGLLSYRRTVPNVLYTQF
jgi:hypothetical protein